MARTTAFNYHLPKSLLNRVLARYAGGDHRPVFYDIAATVPALTTVTAACPAIRAECEAVMASPVPLPAYHEIDRGEATISETSGGARWTVFLLELLGHRPAANRARCPATCRALAAVPCLMQAFFSILEPGRSVPPHEGPYLGYLRYHLGLIVPDRNPPCLRIARRSYTWAVGEAVLFDDTWTHEVENHSDGVRAVLVVDVLRPLPALPALLNRVVLRGLAAPTYGRAVARRAALLADGAPGANGPA